MKYDNNKKKKLITGLNVKVYTYIVICVCSGALWSLFASSEPERFPGVGRLGVPALCLGCIGRFPGQGNSGGQRRLQPVDRRDKKKIQVLVMVYLLLFEPAHSERV